MKPNIIISAGGTGGHIFPGLAIARELADKYNVIWVGAKTGLENTLVPQYGIKLETVSVGGIRNKGIIRKLKLPITLLNSGLECIKILRKYNPVAVVGFGGYATFPICVTAQILRIPVIIHEQNSVAGLTNKLSAKFAKFVLTAFPNVLVSDKSHVVGNPVRQEIISAYSSHKYLNRSDNKLRILIVGGSLGAKVLNDNVPHALSVVKEHILSVTHQVGRGDVNPVIESYKQADIKNVNVVNFIDNMASAYKEHDVIICRAGASTVSEVATVGIAAVFVPYPHAVDDHQTTNARYLSDSDAAILISQNNLTQDSLANIIQSLSLDRCSVLSGNARKLAILDSTQQICNYIEKAVKK